MSPTGVSFFHKFMNGMGMRMEVGRGSEGQASHTRILLDLVTPPTPGVPLLSLSTIQMGDSGSASSIYIHESNAYQ